MDQNERIATGQILEGRYEVQELLGQGGFAAVYRAWDMWLDMPVAVKEVTHPAGLSPEGAESFHAQFDDCSDQCENQQRAHEVVPDGCREISMDQGSKRSCQAAGETAVPRTVMKRTGPGRKALQWQKTCQCRKGRDSSGQESPLLSPFPSLHPPRVL